jgi:hypothetical protein
VQAEIYPPRPEGHPDLEGIFPSGRREIIGYERYLKELARKLRQNMTLGEVLLWQRLKRQAGFLKGTFALPLPDDFDEPLEDFQEYM